MSSRNPRMMRASVLLFCVLSALSAARAEERTAPPRRVYGSSLPSNAISAYVRPAPVMPRPYLGPSMMPPGAGAVPFPQDDVREEPPPKVEEAEPDAKAPATGDTKSVTVKTASFGRYPFSSPLGGYRYPFNYRYYYYRPRGYPFGMGPYTYNYGGYSGNMYAPYAYGSGLFGGGWPGLYSPNWYSPWLWGSGFGTFPGFGYNWGPYTGYSLYYGLGPYTATYSLPFAGQFPGYGYGTWSGAGDAFGSYCDPYFW